MTSDPMILLPLVGLALVLIFCLIIGVVNLGTYYTIRPPKRLPFPTIRHRALSLQQILIPGLLALLTGLLVSLASNFLFNGLTEAIEQNVQFGFIIFVSVFLGFAVISAVWFNGGMEIGDLAKDPNTIAAAAKSLHGVSPEDNATLRLLRRNHSHWKKQSGGLAFRPGSKQVRLAANNALNLTVPRGRPPVRSRWLLLPMMLILCPGRLIGPIITLASTVVALIAIAGYAGAATEIDVASLRAAVITIAILDAVVIALYWWSELVTAVRRYRIGCVTSVAADLALASAASRIHTTLKRDQSINELPTRLERIGTGIMTAAVAVAALSLGDMFRRRH